MKRKKICVWSLLSLTILLSSLLVACSGGGNSDDDEDEDDAGGGSSTPSYSVRITSLKATKKTTTGVTIYVGLATSGISASKVEMLGAQGGSSSSASGGLWGSVGGGETSGTAQIFTASSKKTYYIKGFLQTSSGTVYSAVKKITTP